MPTARARAGTAGARRYRDITPALWREGSLVRNGIGQATYRGRFLLLCRFFDGRLHGLARRHGAEEHCYPALISVETLRRLDYFSSFPQLATFAAHVRDRRAAREAAGTGTPPTRAAPSHVLSPASGYHTSA